MRKMYIEITADIEITFDIEITAETQGLQL